MSVSSSDYVYEYEDDDDETSYSYEEDDRTPAWQTVVYFSSADVVRDQIQAVLSSINNSADLDMNGWCYWSHGAYEPRDGCTHGRREAYTPRTIDVNDRDVHRQFVIAREFVYACMHHTTNIRSLTARILKSAASAWWACVHYNDDAYICEGVFICALMHENYVSVSQLRKRIDPEAPVVHVRGRLLKPQPWAPNKLLR